MLMPLEGVDCHVAVIKPPPHLGMPRQLAYGGPKGGRVVMASTRARCFQLVLRRG